MPLVLCFLHPSGDSLKYVCYFCDTLYIIIFIRHILAAIIQKISFIKHQRQTVLIFLILVSIFAQD